MGAGRWSTFSSFRRVQGHPQSADPREVHYAAQRILSQRELLASSIGKSTCDVQAGRELSNPLASGIEMQKIHLIEGTKCRHGANNSGAAEVEPWTRSQLLSAESEDEGERELLSLTAAWRSSSRTVKAKPEFRGQNLLLFFLGKCCIVVFAAF